MSSESNIVYHAFGLNIASDLPFLNMPERQAIPDVVVRYGAVPDAIPGAVNKSAWYQAAPGAFLFRVDGVAGYHITRGKRITIERAAGALDEEILLFLMGSAMGALLHQRGMLPLHAGAIAVDNEAVLFCGPSGIGKSTLSAAFHKRGLPLLADDVCGVTVGREVRVVAGFSQLKLWEDSLGQLNKSKDGLRRVSKDPDFRKFFVPIDPPGTQALAVRSLFILSSAGKDEFEVSELKGRARIEPVMANTYRPGFLKGLGIQQAHFRMCARLANQARVIRVIRPEQGFRLDELMDLVAAHW
ncbi:hypothetical protein [Desulfobacter vibrioformis]|uniref:hypothetical protein n=1 Tax=Desulfobacter vibrioformis TaxID=34031 RepID=UPI0005557D57|nr:hypothetical protein [Desulfobacter vibrioformis]